MMKFTVLNFHKDTIDSPKSSKHGHEWEIIVGFKLHKIQYVKITLVWNRMKNDYFSHILGDFLAGLSYTQLALRVGPNGMSFVLWMQNPLHISNFLQQLPMNNRLLRVVSSTHRLLRVVSSPHRLLSGLEPTQIVESGLEPTQIVEWSRAHTDCWEWSRAHYLPHLSWAR
jgi:hypothetical protein